jgi:hypothetical protein
MTENNKPLFVREKKYTALRLALDIAPAIISKKGSPGARELVEIAIIFEKYLLKEPIEF